MKRALPLLGAFLLLTAIALACDGNGDGDGSTPVGGETPAATGETPGPSDAETPETPDTEETPMPDPTPLTFSERPEITIDPEKQYFANVETSKGTFRIELRPNIAVQTVNSFVFLARQGYYDGVTFHRVIPGFVAQGGDPTGTGSGSPGYTLPLEPSDVPFERGVVGLARASDPDSGGSQFFVTYADQPALNGLYTVFGTVVEGMEVVDALTPRDPTNLTTPQPDKGDVIITIEIEEVG